MAPSSDSAPTAAPIILTPEQYEALRRGTAEPTVTIPRSEYDALIAQKADVQKIIQERDRFAARMRELETLLRREQQEHQQEYDQLLKAYQKKPA